MNKKNLVGIDIGSTNIKTVIFDENLNILANEAREIEIIYPQSGWTEYDPSLWWDYVKDTAKRAMENANISPESIVGIGVSSLGCCTVPLDEQGNHIYNAIPWSDQRSDKEVNFLENECRDDIYNACGNIPTVLSATPHLMWLKNNEPEIYSKIYKYTEASGFIVQKMTGDFVLDYSMASALDYGINTTTLEYDEKLIEKMDLDLEKYPNLHDNRKAVGGLSAKAAAETGFSIGTPVYLGGLDIVTATVAVGAVSPGQGFYSMGSASNMMIVADKESKSPHLTSLLHIVNPENKLFFGSQATIGFSFKWFNQQFCLQEKMDAEKSGDGISSFEIMSRKAAEIAPGSGGLIYLPFLFGKFHPVFNFEASGVFFGLTATTTREQMIRAVMEGCTYNMYETIKSAQDIGINLDEIITSGGPAQSDVWCQIIADVTNAKVKTLVTTEATPLGNAVIAGLGEALWDDYDTAIEKMIKINKVYTPIPENTVRYQELFDLYKQIYSALQPAYAQLSKLKAKEII